MQKSPRPLNWLGTKSIVTEPLTNGLPHYKQLNFGGGSDWLGATAAALMGTRHAGDKNNVALKSQVLPHDELPVVFPRSSEIKVQFCLHMQNMRTVSSHASRFWF